MIKPTVGRIVWYWPSTADTSIFHVSPQPLAAIVVFVSSDHYINICGFDAEGKPFMRMNVPLVQEGMLRPEGRFAEWMPYQKGQAQKTEALESQLEFQKGVQ